MKNRGSWEKAYEKLDSRLLWRLFPYVLSEPCAVAWSYDLLDDAEKALLDRCSVFASGFDLESACAVAGSDRDEFEVLNLPKASASTICGTTSRRC
jgi:hypothetical protein